MIKLSDRILIISSVVIVIFIIIGLFRLFTQQSKESRDMETGLPCSTSSAEESVETGILPLVVRIDTTVVETGEERYGLLTPPPTPVRLSIDEENPGQANHETRTSIRDICEVLDALKTPKGVLARVLVEKYDWYSNKNVVQVVNMDWTSLTQDWGLRVMGLVGEDRYVSTTEMSSVEGSQGLVLWTNRDLEEDEDFIPNPEVRKALSRGHWIACPDTKV